MAKALKIIGTVVGAVALVATGIGAVAGAAGFLGMSAATWTSIGAIAGFAAGVANIGVGLLTKPPPARGSVTQLTIAPDAPTPYVMGEGYFAGVLRYQRSYGATLDKVPNPYRFMVVTYSGGGPVQSISPRVDFAAVGSYYSGYLYTDTQLGACPESNQLAPQWAGAPNWGSTSKLSGKAAIGWSLKFDKNGKVFANGMPQLGAYIQGVKVYDPRLDSTFPGGSGSCRVDDETTFVYSANPALHAGTYALGRFQNGKRVLGIGLPADAIDWANVAAWANVCDANDWSMFGVVAEPGDRFANLRDICVAGGGEPVLAGGKLYFHYAAPRVSVATIGPQHLLQDQERSVIAQASWRDRLNTIRPKGISPDHNWQLVQDEAVTVSTYLAEDGEVKEAEWAFNFVKDPDQRAQLARYRLEDSRELQAIELPCIYEMVGIRPGDQVDLDLLDELGLDGPAVVMQREFDPLTMAVKLTLVSETPGKHAFALGQTGTPPPTPALGQTAEERDALAAAASTPVGWTSTQIRGAAIKNPRDASNVQAPLLTSDWDAGSGTATLTVARHDWDYPGLDADTVRDTYTFTGLTANYPTFVYFDDDTLVDGSPTYALTQDPALAQNSTAHPNRHALGFITTANSGTGVVEGGETVGYGLPLTYF